MFSDVYIINLSLQLLCLAGAATIFLREYKTYTKSYSRLLGVLLFLITLSILFHYESFSTQMLLGVKFLLLPLIVGVAGASSKYDLRVTFKFIAISQMVSMPFAIYQRQIGVIGMLDQGYQYGVSVTTIESQLRAPALTLTNFEFGLLSATTFLLGLISLSASSELFSKNFSRILLLTSFGGVLVSTSRTSMLIVIFSIISVFLGFVNSRHLSSLQKFIGLGIGFLVTVLSAPYILNSTSLFERLRVWGDLRQGWNGMIGAGIGSIGASTNSSYSDYGTRVVADSYLVSILYQFGLVMGFSIFAYFIYFLRSIKRSDLKAIFISWCLSLVFLESWEYWASTTIVLLAVIYTDSQDESNLSLLSRKHVERPRNYV